MKYLNAAIEAAKLAGSIHKKYFRSDIKVRTKTAVFDLVTVADIESEKQVVSFLKKHYPKHNFIAEEHVYAKKSCDYTWVIDPLDGTANFAGGMPIFCSSVALMYKNEVIVGAVYDVMRDELFYAQKYEGAFLNGKRIYVNKVSGLDKTILITGFYYSRGREMLHTLEAVKLFLLSHIRGIRRFGAAALDLCYVASGRASGYWEFQLSPWDFAAGSLIVEEAGGIVSGRRGEEISPLQKSFIVASNKKIHPQMLKIIEKAYK